MWALKEEGCTHVLVSTACGSLREEIAPGNFVFIDQGIDRTTKREQTFYDGKEGHPAGICHVTIYIILTSTSSKSAPSPKLPMAEPFNKKMRAVLQETAKEMGITHHEK
eukprot:Awhi_evm1s3466